MCILVVLAGVAPSARACMRRHRLLLLLFLKNPDTVQGAYSCSNNFECDDRSGGPVTSSEANLESACDADAACVAYGERPPPRQYSHHLTNTHARSRSP